MFQEPWLQLAESPVQQTRQLQQDFLGSQSNIPRSPGRSTRSLVVRSRPGAGAQRTATLMHHVLRSYSSMMSKNNGLPPFIHPQALYLGPEGHPPEPLANCMSLIHMLSSGFHGSRKLFWRNVCTECEHWCAEVRMLSRPGCGNRS